MNQETEFEWKARAESAEIALSAWQSQFGTSQLSHAVARLEKAESELNSITRQWGEKCERIVELHAEVKGYKTRAERAEKALADIMPFVMDEYHPDFATPSFKAAVEQCQSVLAEVDRLKKVAKGEIADTSGWAVDTTKCPICGTSFSFSQSTSGKFRVRCAAGKCADMTDNPDAIIVSDYGAVDDTYELACAKLYAAIEKELSK